MQGMIAAGVAHAKADWDVIKPLLLKNLWFKLGCLLVISVLHAGDNQAGQANVLRSAIHNPNRSIFGSMVLGLTEWDGSYFLDAALEGYTNIKRFAFYPGFPIVVRSIRQLLGIIPGFDAAFSTVSPGLIMTIVGCMINFTLHLVNTWLLYKWLRLKGFSQQHAKFGALMHVFGSNSVYQVLIYSESLYMFLALSSLYGLALVENDLMRLSLPKFTLLTAVFALSGFARSIGTLNGAYVGYPLLLELVYRLSKKDLRKTASQVLVRILIVIICFLTPTIFLFLRTRRLFCYEPTAQDPYYFAPDFCDSAVGFFYGYVQKNYWGVKPFENFKNPENFSRWWLALFTLVVTSNWLKKAYQTAGFLGLVSLHIPEYLSNHNLKSTRIEELPDLVVTTIQFVSYYGYAYLGSVERFWSATPAYYVFLIVIQQQIMLLLANKTAWPKLLRLLLPSLIPIYTAVRQFFTLVWFGMRIHPI